MMSKMYIIQCRVNMFFAGKNSSTIKRGFPENVSCPKCKAKNSTEISIIGYYKHLLQIPFLSGGKSGKSECEKCGQSFDLKQMPDTVKLAYYELKETTKTPIWYYAGLITIKTLVLIKIFSKYF